VELLVGEAERIGDLKWPAGDPLGGAEVLLRHGGKTFIAHRADGACIFLNESNGRCRIHEQFGLSAKPVGCRLFPFQAAATFGNEITILGRSDCPTIRANQGEPHAVQVGELNRLVSQLGSMKGFDESTCCHLDREQIEAVCDFILALMHGFSSDEHRALFIAYLCDGLALTGADQLDRESLGGAFAVLKQQVDSAAVGPVKRPNWFIRMAFRTLLGLYLRRDEDVLDRRAGRLGRMWGLVRMIAGGGSFRKLGLAHPKGKLKKARLFKDGLATANSAVFGLFWRVVRNRLESFQFMGSANSDRDFLNGLRSLALLYPLVKSAARYHAGNRGSDRIEAEDVEYAVAAIDHSFGRLAILKQPFVRTIENFLLERKIFTRLVRTV
jgi:hypothetical protein